jgi:signal recognition particle GTPase
LEKWFTLWRIVVNAAKRNALQLVQNKYLRIAIARQLKEVMREIAVKTFAKAEKYPNLLVRLALDYYEDALHRHKRPKMALKVKLIDTLCRLKPSEGRIA